MRISDAIGSAIDAHDDRIFTQACKDKVNDIRTNVKNNDTITNIAGGVLLAFSAYIALGATVLTFAASSFFTEEMKDRFNEVPKQLSDISKHLSQREQLTIKISLVAIGLLAFCMMTSTVIGMAVGTAAGLYLGRHPGTLQAKARDVVDAADSSLGLSPGTLRVAVSETLERIAQGINGTIEEIKTQLNRSAAAK